MAEADVVVKALLYTHLLIFLAIVQRPSPYRKHCFLPVFFLSLYLFFFQPITSGFSTTGNSFGCALATSILTASDYILLTDVQNELRLQNDKQHIPSAPLRTRMGWALRLLTSQRAIGWTHEPTGRIRPKPTASRWAFVISRMFWVAYYVVLFDLLQIMMQWNFAVIKGEVNYGGKFGWLLTRISFLPCLIEIHLGVSMTYSSMAAASVTLGLAEPRQWPPIFGHWSEAFTVGRYWGRTWHQVLRRLLTAHGKFVANEVLHLQSGTSLAWHVQLYVAFALSGLLHLAGEYRALNNWKTGGAMRFFVLQALAITFEEMVIKLASRTGFNKTTRASKLIGYVWVLGWMIWTVPSWTGPLAKARIGGPEEKHSMILAIYQQARKNGTFANLFISQYNRESTPIS